MKTQTQNLIGLWQEVRTRFTTQLQNITGADLLKKLPPSPNSAGFLIRHIGEVELLFSKNVFGAQEVKVSAQTVIAKADTGEWTNLEDLQQYVHNSAQILRAILEKQTDSDWESQIETREFGVKTKAEALGRIVSHTAYHAGQLALLIKYGRAGH